MGYNPNIPQSSDFVSQTQKDILRNYQEISVQFGQDHVMIDQVDINRGKHKRVTYIEQSVDPVTVADEQALYTKNLAGIPEMYLAPESAASVAQLTKSGEWQPGLRVVATVTFDSQGNIIEEDNPLPDDPDNKRKIQFNVSSVVPNQPLINGINIWDDWTVNFTNNIPTADYFWNIGWAALKSNSSLLQPDTSLVFNPTNNAAYASSVTANSISITGYHMSNLLSPKRSMGRTSRVNLIIYTVG